MNRKICIIGGSGFLGKKYIELTDKKSNIFVFDKKKINKKKYKIKYIKGDCLSKNTLKKIPDNIDIVIFLVGKIGGPDSLDINNLENYFEVNCQTLLNFLESIKKNSVKKIIFFSTEHVYGNSKKKITDRFSNEQEPKNYYGITKLISEKILKNFYNKSKINIDILRFPRVIALDDKSLLSNLSNTILKKKFLKIDLKNIKFNFLYIDDFIRAIDCCSSKINTGFRVLNIFNFDKPINLKKILEIIKKNFKLKFSVQYKNNPTKLSHNPCEVIINESKYIKDTINWVPRFNNKDIIKKIYIYESKKHNQ